MRPLTDIAWWTRACLLGATVGGLGRLPWAPGTWGSLAALPIWYLCDRRRQGALGQAQVAAAASLLAVALAGQVERQSGAHDLQEIVIDEVAGMLWMACGLPFRWPEVALGFAAFRLLDALKPPPIGWLDRHVPGGLGVVLDDVVAGLLAGAMVHGLRRLRRAG